jgi:hypothetical protein
MSDTVETSLLWAPATAEHAAYDHYVSAEVSWDTCDRGRGQTVTRLAGLAGTERTQA